MGEKSLKQNLSVWLLAFFNLLLLTAGWLMIFYAYPRLPDEIPYWLNLAGQGVLKAAKSPLLFLYPMAQTLFFIFFWLMGSIWVKKPEPIGEETKPSAKKAGQSSSLSKIESEKTSSQQAEMTKEQAAASCVSFSQNSYQPIPNQKPSALVKGSLQERVTQGLNPELSQALKNLKKELILLLLIFFNLIFIHIQRSLIWLAHGLSAGVNKFYFFSLIIIILLLLPYYRFRRRLVIRLSAG